MTTKSRGLQGPSLRVGQPFNPFRLFVGIFVPEALARSREISAGAKLVYGRLGRYAGQDGHCYPAVATLASEIGVCPRQAQKYLAELERARLIRRISRFVDGGQTSNDFEFLWHRMFQEGVNDRSGEGVNDNSPPRVNDRSPKESQDEESQLEESHGERDLDYPSANRQNRDSRMDPKAARVGCRQYPQLREALAHYMSEEGEEERIYPSDRIVIDVMDAAAGAPEEDVIRCLEYLYFKRGLRPGARNGPRHFSWFKTVVAEYFQQRSERDWVINPTRHAASQEGQGGGLSEAEFERMTGAIEIDRPQE